MNDCVRDLQDLLAGKGGLLVHLGLSYVCQNSLANLMSDRVPHVAVRFCIWFLSLRGNVKFVAGLKSEGQLNFNN